MKSAAKLQATPSVPIISPEITEIENLELNSSLEEIAEIDPESVVEEAELLLREAAPHDFDVIVIGAGPGGLACAIHLAQHGQEVALIEKEEVGGVCLNRGCIPTKTLLESIGALRLMRRAQSFGISLSGDIVPDLQQMQARKREVVAQLRRQSEDLAQEAGVKILRGTARLCGDNAIELEETDGKKRRLSAIHIVLATGGKPSKLPIPGADLPGVITSDEILELEQIPRRLIVIGAGAVGIEFAAIFAELGTQTTILEQTNSILPGEDEDIQNVMRKSLEDSGITIVTGCSAQSVELHSGALSVICNTPHGEHAYDAEFVLMAAGRQANIERLSLDKVGVETSRGAIVVEEDGSTAVTGVWAIGDCIRCVGWAHQAALEGRRVAGAILGTDGEIDARFVPTCYYTFPEVASVGLTLQVAEELGIKAHVGRYPFRHNGRANTSGDNGGFVKLVVEVGTGKLLGAQIIGPRATELINEIALALREGATAEQLADALHAHPTFAEVLPGAARAALRQINVEEI